MISGEFNIENVENSESKNTVKNVMPKRAQERLAALKAAGIDTSNLFAMGEQMIVRVENGVPTQVEDDDPIYKGIFDGKTIHIYKLFRRWVLAQTFRMLRNDYTKELKWKGYEYQWRMLEEELRVQAILAKKDPENFEKRNRFFNKRVVLVMCHEYMEDPSIYVGCLKTKKCKGVPYKTIYGRNIFKADIAAKVFSPIRDAFFCVSNACTPATLYEAVRKLNKVRIPMHSDMPQIKAWVDAYKAAGAYYSMENLIRFHGMRLHNAGRELSEKKSLKRLDTLSKTQEGYWLLGMLKAELDDNGISIEKKMKEWRKK